MISSIQGNAGWTPTSRAPQVAASETRGEIENDGDRDDVARSVRAPASRILPSYLGGRIDTSA